MKYNPVYKYITNRLGLVYKHSLWIPHKLDLQQKNNRITKEFLSIHEKSKHQGWRNIITEDQSWFGFYNMDMMVNGVCQKKKKIQL
jgi:hypothetical protein